MPLPAARTDRERVKALEQAVDALHFAAETVKDVMPEPQASGFVSMVSELQSRCKTWREDIEGEDDRT